MASGRSLDAAVYAFNIPGEAQLESLTQPGLAGASAHGRLVDQDGPILSNPARKLQMDRLKPRGSPRKPRERERKQEGAL